MRTPFLSNLGLTPIEQQFDPGPDTFPRAFNSLCQPQWAQAVNFVMGDDSLENWGLAIRNFIQLCVDADRYPYSNLHQSANDQILRHLQDARKSVVKFMNLSKFLDKVTIRTTKREVQMNNQGFTLTTTGNIYLKDPTFVQWLLQMPYPGFRIKDEGRYIKPVGPNTTMIVYNEHANGSQRWHIGYEIVSRQFPDLPGRHLPSKAELETFILDVLWLPTLKAHRPFGYHRRLL